MKRKLIYLFLLFVIQYASGNCVQDHNIGTKQIRDFHYKGIKYNKIGQAIAQYVDSLDHTKSQQDIAYYSLILSDLYFRINSYNNAIDYAQKALKEYKDLKDTLFLIRTYTQIGVIYGSINEFDIATKYFLKVDTLAKLSHNKNAEYHNYVNLGLMNINQKEKALFYLNKAKRFFELTKYEGMDYIGLLNNIAIVFKRVGKYKEAIYLLKKTLSKINKEHPYYRVITSNIAATYLLEGKADSALHYVYKAISKYSSADYLNNYVNDYRILTQSYIIKNKRDSALKYFKLFIQFKDSIALKNESMNRAKLKVIYKTNQLLSNIDKQKYKIKEYHIKVIALSIIVLLLILIFLIFFIFHKRLQASYRNIVKESVKSIEYEKENKYLQDKIKSLKGTLKENKTTKTKNIVKNSDEIFLKIEELFRKEKLYTNPNLDLNMLAERLQTNRTYVSNIINMKTGYSFVAYVNRYRVEEAKRLLVDVKSKKLTLEAIGKAAGFNSTSTFNRVFKTETGVTPSFFMKHKQG